MKICTNINMKQIQHLKTINTSEIDGASTYHMILVQEWARRYTRREIG